MSLIMRRSAPALLLAAVATVACGTELEDISQVTKFRVLGVQTDPPEVNPGGTVAIRVLTADPAGDGRMVVAGGMVVAGALTPSSSGTDYQGSPQLFWPLGFTAAIESSGIVDLGDLGVPEVAMGPDGDLAPLLEEGDDPLTMTAIVLMCAGDGFSGTEMNHAIADLFGPDPSTARLDDPTALEGLCVTAGADEGLVAFKTFDITLNTDDPNTNPEIDSLEIKEGFSVANAVLEGNKTWVEVLQWAEDGDPGTFQCGGDECRDIAKLRAYLTKESFQRYEKVEFGETKTVDERLYVSWFIDGGEFDVDRSGNDGTHGDPFEVQWLPPREGGRYHLWVVAHDIRGGVSWQRFMLDAVIP